MQPSHRPTLQPTEQPSRRSTVQPMTSPSLQQPTWQPTKQLFERPSSRPTLLQSFQPYLGTTSMKQSMVIPISQSSSCPTNGPMEARPSVSHEAARAVSHVTSLPSSAPSSGFPTVSATLKNTSLVPKNDSNIDERTVNLAATTRYAQFRIL